MINFLTKPLSLLGAAFLLVTLTACDETGFGGTLTPVTLAYDSSSPDAGSSVANVRLSQAAASAYSGNRLFWHNADGRPNAKGHTLYGALKAASAHGLRPDYYLTTDLLAQDGLARVSPAQARIIDRALTQGLYKFAGDFKYGRYNPDRPAGVAPFRQALGSSNINTWIGENEPRGRSYSDLRSQLRNNPGLSPQQRSSIAINMERLRWKPETAYGSATIRVNIADAILETFNGNSRDDIMRVIVGREERFTPLLTDVIRDLKFSPDWTVPPTIIEKDFLPRLAQNPNYLDSDQYEVLVNGRPPSEVRDWSAVEPEDVFIRRASSEAGPLGGVRFSMYNRDAIFLHDTPSRGLFERSFRAYSSGCVRVQRAQDLAAWVMSRQPNGLSRDQVGEKMRAGVTESVGLANPIQVNLLYMTTYVDGAGALTFTGDPYFWDRGLAGQMGLSRATARAVAPDPDVEYDLGP